MKEPETSEAAQEGLVGPADAEPSWEEVQGLFRSMGCGRLLQRLDHLRGFLEDHRSLLWERRGQERKVVKYRQEVLKYKEQLDEKLHAESQAVEAEQRRLDAERQQLEADRQDLSRLRGSLKKRQQEQDEQATKQRKTQEDLSKAFETLAQKQMELRELSDQNQQLRARLDHLELGSDEEPAAEERLPPPRVEAAGPRTVTAHGRAEEPYVDVDWDEPDLGSFLMNPSANEFVPGPMSMGWAGGARGSIA
ncbi:unnamed protein product [Effrenium voratum]|uniref:Uncharacterized protein n=1 Tax=Effrenium voratum TaxID=2562239 RepID=A0AA36I168_9DINO|nr:unnamed protein product [Effrenium voratum]CAJ1453437.1 unnamed protein product [Effrenium voratum]